MQLKKSYIILGVLLTTWIFSGYSCSEKSLVDSKISPVVRDFLNIGSSTTIKGIDLTNAGIDTLKILENLKDIIKIDTVTTNVSIKVLEKYDSPFIEADEIVMSKTENIPNNSRVVKVISTYRTGNVKKQETIVYEPVKETNSTKFILVISLVTMIILYIVSFLWFSRKLNKLNKEKTQ